MSCEPKRIFEHTRWGSGGRVTSLNMPFPTRSQRSLEPGLKGHGSGPGICTGWIEMDLHGDPSVVFVSDGYHVSRSVVVNAHNVYLASACTP